MDLKCEEWSESEEEISETLEETQQEATASVTANVLPSKSKYQYERAYNLFMNWCGLNEINSFSEDVLLAYFKHLSIKMKPSSLWAIYSMLRSTINIKNNVDISKYYKLCAFLKCASDGYKPKKSKTLTPQQIKEFLTSAPDSKYLFIKVGIIFGIMGACRREELIKIETGHVEDLNTALLVHIPDTKTKTERQFVIGGSFYNICKKYMELRPSNLQNSTRFFLNYQRGKCTKQPIGINKFGSLFNQVAKYLKLPDPTSYTGHCLRRPSSTFLVDSGANITTLKRHRVWLSTSVAEEYIDDSNDNKIQISNNILRTVENSVNDNNQIEQRDSYEIANNTNLNFEVNQNADTATTNFEKPLITFQNCSNVSNLTINVHISK